MWKRLPSRIQRVSTRPHHVHGLVPDLRPQLSHDSRKMIFHCKFRNPQVRRNFRHQLHQLALPAGQACMCRPTTTFSICGEAFFDTCSNSLLQSFGGHTASPLATARIAPPPTTPRSAGTRRLRAAPSREKNRGFPPSQTAKVSALPSAPPRSLSPQSSAASQPN